MRPVPAAVLAIALAAASVPAAAAEPRVLARWDAGSGAVTPLPGGGVVVTRPRAYVGYTPEGRRRWVVRVPGGDGSADPLPVVTGPRSLRVGPAEIRYGPGGRVRVSATTRCRPGVSVEPSLPGMNLLTCAPDGSETRVPLDAAWRGTKDFSGFPSLALPSGDVLAGLSTGEGFPFGTAPDPPGDLMRIAPGGQVVWRSRVGADAVVRSLATGAGTAYATWQPALGGPLSAGAWDLATGAPLWSRAAASGGIVADPSGGVVVSDPAGAVLIERDGVERWRTPAAPLFRPLGIAGGAVVGTVGDGPRQPRTVVAISLATGRREWTHRTRMPVIGVATTPGRVYVGTRDGVVTALSAGSVR